VLKSIDLKFKVDPKSTKDLGALLNQDTELDSAFRSLAKQAGKHREITALWGRRCDTFGSACSQSIVNAEMLRTFLSSYIANKDDFGLYFRGIVPNKHSS
jgi:hypothetical protein